MHSKLIGGVGRFASSTSETTILLIYPMNVPSFLSEVFLRLDKALSYICPHVSQVIKTCKRAKVKSSFAFRKRRYGFSFYTCNQSKLHGTHDFNIPYRLILFDDLIMVHLTPKWLHIIGLNSLKSR